MSEDRAPSLPVDLAKRETEVARDAVLDRLRELQLDPAVDDVPITGMIFVPA